MFSLLGKHPEAQIHGHLSRLEKEPRWKQTIRSYTTRFPAFEVCFLAPLCSLGQKFFQVPALGNIGVRALQIRRRIHWLRVVRRLTAS